jgi:hypothetical protein
MVQYHQVDGLIEVFLWAIDLRTVAEACDLPDEEAAYSVDGEVRCGSDGNFPHDTVYTGYILILIDEIRIEEEYEKNQRPVL